MNARAWTLSVEKAAPALPAFLDENPRLGKIFRDTALLRVLGGATQDGRWGSDGACLEWPSESSEDPIGYLAGSNLYEYCRNNPVIFVDPSGLDTYYQLRPINSPWISWTGISHGFVFTTNPDGTVNSTYSWGNTANPNGWSTNQPEDIAAAQNGLNNNSAQRQGGSDLDPYVAGAYNQLNKPANRHRWWPWNQCRTEANNLLNTAQTNENGANANGGQGGGGQGNGGGPPPPPNDPNFIPGNMTITTPGTTTITVTPR